MRPARTISRVLATLWLCLGACAAGAQTPEPGLPPLVPDIARIVERGTLVVAQLNENYPPMFSETEDGELAGFDVSLAEAMARDLGVDLEIVRTAQTYDAVVWQVAAGEADLGISWLSRTPRRAKHVLFSQPYAQQNFTLLINRVKALKFRGTCPTVEELMRTAESADVLGLEGGSSTAARVRAINPDTQPREFPGADEAMAAARTGEVAISLQGELAARRFLAGNPAAQIRLRLCEIGEGQDLIGIAVPPGRYDLLHWVNVFLDDHEVDYDAAELIAHRGAWVFQ